MNEPVCIRQRFHKSFLHVPCVSEGVNGILIRFQNVCRCARLMRLPHFFFLFAHVQGGGVGGGAGIYACGLAQISVLLGAVIMCSQGHNYMSENVTNSKDSACRARVKVTRLHLHVTMCTK